MAGKTVVVTGAARGMGRSHALTLACEGANVIAIDLASPLPPCVQYDSATAEDLAETARLVEDAGARIHTAVADIRDLDALREAVPQGVAQFGRLDAVVANAGIVVANVWHAITAEEFAAVIDTNVTGTWNTVMATASHIIDGGRGGSVILVSSRAGLTLQPFMVHYTASKHAITGMARAFAAELGPHGIRVNSLHPGTINTHMASPAVSEDLISFVGTAPYLATVGTPFLPDAVIEPQEVSNAVLFLASDESANVNAMALPVDGGAQFV
jgi:SDR family mycofactocin-dependent oxidoreductase